MSIKPYKINVEQYILDDLYKRLKRTRWSRQEHGASWDYGTDPEYLKDFVDYWINTYDWRKEEARLNEFSWFSATIDGKNVNFIHAKGEGPNSTPVILLHGWPDSVMRYIKLIPMLTHPQKYGGNADDSFDVIVPSYIGGFSDTSGPPIEHPVADMAEICWQLMVQTLGYKKFIAHGGDGGSPIAQIIAVNHPENLIGIHLTDVGWHATARDQSELTEIEKQYLQNLQYAGFSDGAYAMVQGTIPQTLGLALNDSPVGMAAWIIEKFRTWSDCNGDIESIFSKEELITNIMLYWLKNSVKSFSYKEEFVSGSIKANQVVSIPVALAFPPADYTMNIPPREFVARNFKNISRWAVLERGGHFAAMEFPDLVAADIRNAFK